MCSLFDSSHYEPLSSQGLWLLYCFWLPTLSDEFQNNLFQLSGESIVFINYIARAIIINTVLVLLQNIFHETCLQTTMTRSLCAGSSKDVSLHTSMFFFKPIKIKVCTRSNSWIIVFISTNVVTNFIFRTLCNATCLCFQSKILLHMDYLVLLWCCYDDLANTLPEFTCYTMITNWALLNSGIAHWQWNQANEV